MSHGAISLIVGAFAGFILGWLAAHIYRGVSLSIEQAPASAVIADIAELLHKGPLTKSHIETNGICEMGVSYLGHPFLITWYSLCGNRLRSISLGDGTTMFTTLPEAKYLLSIAVDRGNRLFRERVSELEQMRAAVPGEKG